MPDAWILEDHTWIEVRRKSKLMHSLYGRPIPRWMGGAIHLPSAGAALAAAVAGFAIFGIPTISRLRASNQPAMVALLIIEVFLPLVIVYSTWQRIAVLSWAQTQVDWLRQEKRSTSPASGGAEPDQFEYSVILFKPVDAGWLALARTVYHGGVRAQTQER